MLSKKLHLGLTLSDNSNDVPLNITKTSNNAINSHQWKEKEGLEWLHPQLDPYNPYKLHHVDFKDRGNFYFVKSIRGIMRHLGSDCMFIEKKKFVDEKCKFEKYKKIKFISEFQKAKMLSSLVQFTKFRKKSIAKSAVESSLRISYSKFIINSIPEFQIRESTESIQTLHQCIINVLDSARANIVQVKTQMQLLVDTESQNASKWLLTNVTIQKLVRLVEYMLVDHCVQFFIRNFNRIEEMSFVIVHNDDLNSEALFNIFENLNIAFDLFKLNDSDRLFSHAAIIGDCVNQNTILKSNIAAWILAVENVQCIIYEEKLKCLVLLEETEIDISKFSEIDTVKIGKLNIRFKLFRSQWIRDFAGNHPHLQPKLVNLISFYKILPKSFPNYLKSKRSTFAPLFYEASQYS